MGRLTRYVGQAKFFFQMVSFEAVLGFRENKAGESCEEKDSKQQGQCENK